MLKLCRTADLIDHVQIMNKLATEQSAGSAWSGPSRFVVFLHKTRAQCWRRNRLSQQYLRGFLVCSRSTSYTLCLPEQALLWQSDVVGMASSVSKAEAAALSEAESTPSPMSEDAHAHALFK